MDDEYSDKFSSKVKRTPKSKEPSDEDEEEEDYEDDDFEDEEVQAFKKTAQ
jgi:hypothetical protein